MATVGGWGISNLLYLIAVWIVVRLPLAPAIAAEVQETARAVILFTLGLIPWAIFTLIYLLIILRRRDKRGGWEKTQIIATTGAAAGGLLMAAIAFFLLFMM
jgi:hypothetical protein